MLKKFDINKYILKIWNSLVVRWFGLFVLVVILIIISRLLYEAGRGDLLWVFDCIIATLLILGVQGTIISVIKNDTLSKYTIKKGLFHLICMLIIWGLKPIFIVGPLSADPWCLPRLLEDPGFFYFIFEHYGTQPREVIPLVNSLYYKLLQQYPEFENYTYHEATVRLFLIFSEQPEGELYGFRDAFRNYVFKHYEEARPFYRLVHYFDKIKF
jgi:hypothetical protein